MAALVLAVAAGACGAGGDRGDGSDTGADSDRARSGASRPACGPVVEEPLDARSTTHLLPSAPEPTYLADPPTSGPHVAGPVPTGVRTEPLPRPVQVAVLEKGGVVVQHRGLPDTERRRLEALAGEEVVVAPQPALPAPVVATAWRHRLECRSAAVAPLEGFIDAHRGQGPRP